MVPDDGSRSTAVMPVPVEDMRLELLRAAGVTPELLKDAVTRLKDALLATDKKVISHQGVVTSVIEVANWDAVLRATDQLFSLLGAYAPRRAEGGGTKVQVQVAVAPFAQRNQGATIIEASPAISAS